MTKNEFLNQVNVAAEPYGYAVDESGRVISPQGEALSLTVSIGAKGRVHVRTQSGNLLFSGGTPASIAGFLESFYYAEKITA